MIEEIIFHSLFTNKEYYSTAKDIVLVNENIFSDDNIHRSIKIIKHFVEKKKINPTYDDLILFIENDPKLKEKEYKSIQTFLITQKTKEPFTTSLENLKEQTLKFIKDRLTMSLLERGAALIVGENSKDSLESIQEEMKKINLLGFDNDLGVFLENTEIFEEYDIDRVPTGFKPIDDLLGGGYPRGTFNAYLALPHTGKSQTMLFLAARAAISALLGMKVTYITAEMRTNMTRQRLDSIILKIPTLKLNSKNMSIKEYEDKYKELRKTIRGNVNIKYFPSSTANANNVAKHLKLLADKKDYKTDLLLIDSINLMRPIDTRITKLQKHIWMEALTIDFREMSDELNLTTITVAQINREGAKVITQGADIDTSVIGEFFMLAGFADSLIGIKQMYSDGENVYNDRAMQRITEESANDEFKCMREYRKSFDKILKFNLIKCRFGTKIDTHIFLGSLTNLSTLVDIGMNLKDVETTENSNYKKDKTLRNPEIEKQYKEEKKEFKKDNGELVIESYSARRKKLA